MGNYFQVTGSGGSEGLVDFKKKGSTNLVLEFGTSLPASGTEGHIFWKSDTDTLYVDSGAAWQVIGSTSFPTLAPDGTASAPSYSFSGDSTVGMYRTGSGYLGLSEMVSIDSTLHVYDGLGANPGIHFQGASSNTGFYNSGNSLLYIVGGGIYANFNTTSYIFNLSGRSTLNAGINGEAATLNVYPSTSNRGTLTFSAANNTGNTVTTITNASQAGTRTYTIPDTGTSSSSFLMTDGSQSVNKTLTWNTGFLYTNLGTLSLPGLALNGTDKVSGLTGGSGGHNIVLVANAQNALEADGDANTVVVGSFNMGIGGSPITNGLLTITSTTKAFVPPRMTSTQRNAIGTPTAGMIVYNSTDNQVSFYDGTTWNNLASGGVSYPLLAPAGTAAAPSYSWSADSDSGFYSITGGQFAASTNNQVSTIFTTDGLETTGGNAGHPAYTFAGDTDNGMYRIGANNVGFAAGGAQIFNFDTTGVYPNSDNTKDLGSASFRWNDIYGTTLHSGDIELDNKWRITEGYKAGHPEEGIMFLSPEGKKFKIAMTEVE